MNSVGYGKLVADNHQFHKQAGFWWNRNYNSVASITLTADGNLVFNGRNYDLEIHNIGTDKEKVVVKNGADLVL
jgi:maltose-binding protein MalE